MVLPNGTVEIKPSFPGYSGNLLVVPAKLAGKTVTSIGESAFYGCKTIRNIILPDTIVEIKDQAFIDCTELTSISIPDGVTSIGGKAFMVCTSLTSISIPNSVTTIGLNAFSGCTSLLSVRLPNPAPTIGAAAFDGTPYQVAVLSANYSAVEAVSAALAAQESANNALEELMNSEYGLQVLQNLLSGDNSILSKITNNEIALQLLRSLLDEGDNSVIGRITNISEELTNLKQIQNNIQNTLVTQPPIINTLQGKDKATAVKAGSNIQIETLVSNASHYRINNGSWQIYNSDIITVPISKGINQILFEFSSTDMFENTSKKSITIFGI